MALLGHKAKMASRLSLFLLGVGLMILQSAAMEFTVNLLPLQKKCFEQQVTLHTLFIAEAKLGLRNDGKPHDVQLYVLCLYSGPIFQDRGKEVMKTAFTTTHAAGHRVCLENFESDAVSVPLTVKWGPEAKDYSQVAKKEHLDKAVVALRMVEDGLRNYHKNLLYLRSREIRLQATTDSTARRLVVFFGVNMILMVITTAVQVCYFREFFRTKKII